MTLNRRGFLAVAGGALAAAHASWARATVSTAETAKPLLRANNEIDWQAVRGEFDLDPKLLNLSTFYLASHPRPVREAIERLRKKIDANPMWLDEALVDPGLEFHGLRQALARYLGAGEESFALMPNTTTALSMVYNGLTILPGQELLTSEHDHYAHQQAMELAAAKRGAVVRYFSLHEQAARASVEDMTDRLRRAIGPRTRAVGLTWVYSSTGLKLPVGEMAAVVRAANAGRSESDRCLLVLDGVHGLGVEDVDAASLGADFFASGTHKWLFGPRGTGILWGREDAWPHLRPSIPSFESGECWEAWMAKQPLPATRAPFVSPGGFVPFEHLLAIGDAVLFHERLGRARVTARIHALNRQLREGLAGMRNVTLHTPLATELAGGIACFEMDGLTPRDIVRQLRGLGIVATTSPYKVSYARLAAGIMIQEEDVERALRAVRGLRRT